MTSDRSRFGEFLRELKHRRVYHVAVVYAAVGFVVLQFAEIAFPALLLPDWALTLVVVLVLLGFPIALVLAWAFELSPEGLRRTRSEKGAEPDRATPRPSLRATALASLAVAAVIFVSALLFWGSEPEVPQIRSLAVLPLDNLSPSEEEEYFADGMTEALISRLARIGDLAKVTSRTSVMRYKDTRKSIPEIAAELDVDALIEGTVTREEERVRITAQLIHGPSDRHLWSEEYVASLTDVLELQGRVARAIATEIRAQVTPIEEERMTAARPVDREAYLAYLKGRHAWSQRRPDGILRSIDWFNEALDLDPTYAPAYAGLADAYLVSVPGARGAIGTSEALRRAESAAERAVQLDPELAEAHTSLAYLKMLYEWDWSGAEWEFLRALDLNPSYATAYQWYAEYLTALGRHDEAIGMARRGAELDPLSEIVVWTVPYTLYMARRYEEALEASKRVLELAPGSGRTHALRSWCYERLGRDDDAYRELQKAMVIEGAPKQSTDLMARAYAEEGFTGVSREVLRDRSAVLDETDADQLPLVLLFTSEAYVRLGMHDRLFELIETAVEERTLHFWVVNLLEDPALDPIRSDPRYEAIVQRIGIE